MLLSFLIFIAFINFYPDPRFGLEQAVTSAEEEKKKARLARFAPVAKVDSVEEEKRKARALR